MSEADLKKAMKKAGLNMTCTNNKDWFHMLDKYISSHKSRELAGIAGKRIAEEDYSEEDILRRWDKVFESISWLGLDES